MSDRPWRTAVGVVLVLGALLLEAAPASAVIFPVDSNADTGDATPDGTCGTGPGTCTLREAIDEANALDGDDTITLPADTYDLDLGGADDTNAAGDFDVTDADDTLTIDGTGTAAATLIDGDDLDRLFDIGNNASLALVDVTVTDGTASTGGGIEVDGNPSTLTLTRAVVSGNVATSSGGGINMTTGSAPTALVAVSATDSTIADNDAASGGGINNTSSDAISLTDSDVTGNETTGSGGGLNLTGSEGLTLTRTTISGNDAGTQGGGINNSSDSDPETITNSSIAGNTATTNGGGIYHTASGGPDPGLLLTGTTVSGNTATNGSGGGIYNTGSPISLTNSTFSGNGAPSAGGGAIHHTGGHVTATHVTFSGNSAGQGGGINQASPTNTTLTSTILAAGSSGGACSGSPGSAGSNIASDGTCGLAGAGDRSGVNPLLGPLTANGGPTQTHALLAGSPAIDAAAAAACPPTDQRGTGRPLGAGCDIGAFEATPGTSPVTGGPSPAPGGLPQCSDRVDNDGDGAVDRADAGCLSGPGDTYNPADQDEGNEGLRDLVLCGRRPISLVRADVRGRNVVLSGVVASRFAGRPVEIHESRIRGTRGARRLTRVRPNAEGVFRARVRRPSRRLLNRVRYQARVGRNRSVALKLPQSLSSTSIQRRGSGIVIRGKVKRSVLGKRNPVVIRRVTCGRYQRVGQSRPKRSGSYVVRFPAPRAADVALYRAETRVLARPGSRRYVRQFARAISIRVGGGTG